MNEIVADIQSKNNERNLRISIHQVDVGSADQIEAMFQDIDAKHGQRPDILISNAGYGKRIPDVSEISLEEFDFTMNINLRASFILVKGVVEHMKAQKWGRIIFMSSIAAQGGGINGCRKFISIYLWGLKGERIHTASIPSDKNLFSDYAASKGGLSGMMKNLSTRLAEYNISVNDVAPAMIGDTGMLSSAAAFPEVAASVPLKRLGTPEETANVVIMLAKTGYMTGQSLLLAGGLK